MLTATYAESVSSTPAFAIGEPIGPIEKGNTYMVRPRMHPSNSRFKVGAHFARVHPVIGRSRVVLSRRADEGAIFHARYIRRMRASEIAPRAQLLVQTQQRAACDELRAEPIVFSLRPVAPDDALRFHKLRNLRNPVAQTTMSHPVRGAEGCRTLWTGAFIDHAPENKTAPGRAPGPKRSSVWRRILPRRRSGRNSPFRPPSLLIISMLAARRGVDQQV
jgi:hypothetical protein